MSAKLGLEVPFTTSLNQTFVLRNYVDAPTEIVMDAISAGSPVPGSTQVWKITHNGVDTHPVHFHLFDVQLINRVGWDGAIRLPDANELGWKDTVRISPLEDTIVALRAVAPRQPFGVPDSIRYLNPALPPGATDGFTATDQFGNPIVPAPANTLYNFGWEYVWHCHILSHEEADMMRPIEFRVGRALPAAPVLTYRANGSGLVLTWTDPTPRDAPSTLGNLSNEIGFRVERAPVAKNGRPGTYVALGSALANQTTFTDSTAVAGTAYSYRVVAFNVAGSTVSNAVQPAPAPTNVLATSQSGPQIRLTWTDNSSNETGFILERSVGGSSFAPLTVVGSNITTYTDTAVVAGQSYMYRVAASDTGGQSTFTLSSAVSIPLQPAAPMNLIASAVRVNNRAEVTLNWTDLSNNETGFTIERATDAGFTANVNTFTAAANATTLTQSGLPRGVTYYYRIRADNVGGSSAWVNATPFPITTP
jgi:hypothetical protein